LFRLLNRLLTVADDGRPGTSRHDVRRAVKYPTWPHWRLTHSMPFSSFYGIGRPAKVRPDFAWNAHKGFRLTPWRALLLLSRLDGRRIVIGRLEA
jgi:hypothetical protein